MPLDTLPKLHNRYLAQQLGFFCFLSWKELGLHMGTYTSVYICCGGVMGCGKHYISHMHIFGWISSIDV
jgi:hypothetical protein